MNTVADLFKRIHEANVAYRAGKPVMSDAAYDALEDQLRALDPNHPHFKTVGAPPDPLLGGGWPKVRHSIPMGSLNKCQFDADAAKGGGDGYADLKAWWPGKSVCMTHKLDGISIGLVYRHRKLVQAITRGDGDIGEDITRNVLLMQGAVKMLPSMFPVVNGSIQMPETVYVRGEIICRKSDFAQYFPGESNPRNTAAGTAKRQSDPDKCKHLTVVAYQFMPDGVALDTKVMEINALKGMGFTVTPWYECPTLAIARTIYDGYVATKRDALDYEIDGLVLDVDKRDEREAMGDHNQRPRGAVAFKFPHDQKDTTLLDIRWQVGKSGRLTPVADFNTVVLTGANVSKASLHNIDLIDLLCQEAKATCLHVGDTILVSRRNDVIPFVEALLISNPTGLVLATPTNCTECNSVLVRDGAYLRCTAGDTCPAQIAGAVKRWIEKIGVLHFGTALIDMLCETGKVETIADLYKLDPKEVAQMGMGGRQVGGTAAKAFNNLHANKTIPLHVFIGSLGIPLIGRSMAKTIVDAGFDSLNKMSKAKVSDIAAIPGVGNSKAEAFCDGFWDLLDRGTITGLLTHITVAAKATGAMTDKSVCFTGVRDKALEAAIEALGGTIKGSVGKGLSYLVCKEANSTSTKAQAAAKLGIEVLSLDEMWDMVGGRP